MAQITLDQFVALHKDQSVLFNTSDKSLRGQCVQLVCFYAQEVINSSVMWADAKEWWTKFSLGQWYDKIPYPGNLPKRGDIVVWDGDVPGSAGAGHIDICLQDGSQATFLGFDSNWNGKTAHIVQHTYQHVLGFLRPKEQEPMFNEGDRYNVNYSLYGSDKGFHKDAIGKPWKQAMDVIFRSDEYRNEHFVNDGDTYNRFRFFAGREPSQADLDFHRGLVHKADIENLMVNQDVKAHQGNSVNRDNALDYVSRNLK